MKAIQLLSFIILVILFSCQSDQSSTDDNPRPHDPWIFRSVLDQQPRMITLALDVNLWAAYSTENCAPYQAWKGVVNFEGAVYDTQHGPQPLSVGEKYVVNKFEDPWSIIKNNGDTTALSAEYKGHKIVNDQPVLMYELNSDDLSSPILVEETVDAYTNKNGQAVFTRSFSTSQIEEGHTLALTFNLSSIVVKANVNTNGIIQYSKEEEVVTGDVTSLDLVGYLLLNSNSITDLKVTFMVNPIISNPNFVSDEDEDDNELPEGLKYIAKSDCKTCHNKNIQTIGPSYVSIAERYPATDDNISLLMSKIINGGSGIWGSQVMTPHLDLGDTKARAMIEYILSLSDREVTEEATGEAKLYEPVEVDENSIVPGLIVKVYLQRPGFESFADVDMSNDIHQAGVLPNLANIRSGDFRTLDDNFAMSCEGYLGIDEAGIYNFRIWSDDGSRVYLNDELILNNDGMHGTIYKEGSATLKKGFYPVRVEYYQGGGGKFLSFNWKPEGAGEYQTIPMENLFHKIDDRKNIISYTLPMGIKSAIPGDGNLLVDVHPSFDLYQARPFTFTPKVGGMDFFSDGRLAISTWDPEGAVYVLDNLKAENPEDIIVTKIANGLAEPLGLKIVDDEIYIMQKQELTHLIDNNNDGVIDEYRTICDDWLVSANFHEFGFGLEYKDGYFYASLATAIEPGGASTQPQIPDRGKVVKISKEEGTLEFIASGLRTPNGIGWGYNGELFVCDNQGDWLPSSKVLHITEGAWYGSRSVDPEGTKNLIEKRPVVWLPQDEIGNSPSTPSSIDVGPYKGQMIHGEVTNGGVKRVFVEEAEGQLQGALFRFIQGLEAGVNRLTWSPDGDLYIGGIGNPGNWGQSGKLDYGLQRLSYNGTSTFEMLAVRAKSNGLEIEFTESLKENEGWQKTDYEVKQWYYLPTIEYGGPKIDQKFLDIRSVNVSEDRKKVFLELNGMKENHVIYVHLVTPFISEKDNDLWSTEVWYTMNRIPKNNPGFKSPAPAPILPNTLTDSEKAKGWKLLFDGTSTNGWRNFKKQTIGSSWKVKDGILYLDSKQTEEGGWQAKDGGDIITDRTYENYDFTLEWKISNCGNSGVIFNVVEDDKYNYVWETGPEMQILDNTCHPDTRFPTHRAGDLYDLIETKYVTVKPAGEWNKVRILSDNGKVRFWLNGYKLVEFEMHNKEWKERIANSKFKDMPDFGLSRDGHLSLQDHGDPVYFRNIKIREL